MVRWGAGGWKEVDTDVDAMVECCHHKKLSFNGILNPHASIKKGRPKQTELKSYQLGLSLPQLFASAFSIHPYFPI